MLAQGGNTPQALDSWIAIGADGNVVVYTGRADMGQGTYTVQYQLAAEELSVPMNRIRSSSATPAMTPDQGTSSGSQCHPVNFNHENLAQACATAREALVAMAATAWRVRRAT
jgi:CO/xanthine dehydrogenase Mo-binding subunit